MLERILGDLGIIRKRNEAAQIPAQPPAVEGRLVRTARTTALTNAEGDERLVALSDTLVEAGLVGGQSREVLVRGWETAVQGALEDGVISEDEEAALSRYLDYFGIEQAQADRSGALTTLAQAGAIRDLTEGTIPQRQNIQSRIPFNLMKSEELVWVFDGVAYLEDVTRREMRGSSQGLTIRIARGIYYRPSAFKSRVVEWDETVRLDTGLMGLTTKHIYFAGDTKRFRVRYDRIVAFEPYSDGIGIMREAQTAKPQTFITNDGWFTYNMATNLAQM